jgi:hypothetical protein
MWEKIIKAYRELPEPDRTSDAVAAYLQAQGNPVSASHVRKVLEATMLEEVSADAIETTSQTLKVLMDISGHMAMPPDESHIQHAESLTRGLRSTGPTVPGELNKAISRLLARYDYHRQVQAECAYHERMAEMAEQADDDLDWPFG